MSHRSGHTCSGTASCSALDLPHYDHRDVVCGIYFFLRATHVLRVPPPEQEKERQGSAHISFHVPVGICIHLLFYWMCDPERRCAFHLSHSTFEKFFEEKNPSQPAESFLQVAGLYHV